MTATRPSLVFVHGTRLTSATWEAQRAVLGGAYRIVAPDLPAHGARADEPFTLAAAADIVVGVLQDELAAVGRPAVLIGLSLGGFVAMDVAARRPDLVGGLVLAGASAEPTGILAIPLRVLEWILRTVPAPIQERANGWYFRARYPPAIADPLIAGGFWTRGGADALRALRGERFASRLAAYPGPSLLINGAWDPFFRWGAAAFAAAAVDARRVRVARASHLVNLDQPEVFAAAVERFVVALPASPDRPAGADRADPGARLAPTPDAP